MKPYTWRAAILKSGLPPTTRHVLLTLSCYINDVGQSAYPSTKRLADDTGLSERAVITHLQNANKAGWLEVKKHGFGGQNWARNEYFPRLPDDWSDDKGTEADSAPIGPFPPAGNSQKGTEDSSAPDEKALNVVPKGTERRSEGTEPNDKKALNVVQSNRPIELSSKRTNKKKPAAGAASVFDAHEFLTGRGVNPAHARDWLKVRKEKKLTPTETALEAVLAEAGKCGMTLAQAIERAATEGWAGFKASWILKPGAPSGVGGLNRQEALEASNMAVAMRLVQQGDSQT